MTTALALWAALIAAPTAASTSTPTTAPSALEQGLQRELVLLLGERDALIAERERLEALRAARVAAAQQEVAALQAKLVVAAADEEKARLALAATAAPAAPTPVPATAHDTLRAALLALHLDDDQVAAPGTTPLVSLLPTALERLSAMASTRTIDSGFFAADGSWHTGRVVRWGSLSTATSSDGLAGALLPALDNTLQLAPPTTSQAEVAAAAQAIATGTASTWPVAFAATSSADDDEGSVTARLSHLGPAGIAAAVLGLLALLTALVATTSALLRKRALDAVAVRLTALVAAGEDAAASALARTVGGPAGRFLQAAVALARHNEPEDEMAALSAEAATHTGLGLNVARGAFGFATAASLLATAVGVGDALRADQAVGSALAGALVPLQVLFAVAVPWVLLVVVGGWMVSSTHTQLEALALRVLAAARSTTAGDGSQP
jgi:hypothetical protein